MRPGCPGSFGSGAGCATGRTRPRTCCSAPCAIPSSRCPVRAAGRCATGGSRGPGAYPCGRPRPAAGRQSRPIGARCCAWQSPRSRRPRWCCRPAGAASRSTGWSPCRGCHSPPDRPGRCHSHPGCPGCCRRSSPGHPGCHLGIANRHSLRSPSCLAPPGTGSGRSRFGPVCARNPLGCPLAGRPAWRSRQSLSGRSAYRPDCPGHPGRLADGRLCGGAGLRRSRCRQSCRNRRSLRSCHGPAGLAGPGRTGWTGWTGWSGPCPCSCWRPGDFAGWNGCRTGLRGHGPRPGGPQGCQRSRPGSPAGAPAGSRRHSPSLAASRRSGGGRRASRSCRIRWCGCSGLCHPGVPGGSHGHRRPGSGPGSCVIAWKILSSQTGLVSRLLQAAWLAGVCIKQRRCHAPPDTSNPRASLCLVDPRQGGNGDGCSCRASSSCATQQPFCAPANQGATHAKASASTFWTAGGSQVKTGAVPRKSQCAQGKRCPPSRLKPGTPGRPAPMARCLSNAGATLAQRRPGTRQGTAVRRSALQEQHCRPFPEEKSAPQKALQRWRGGTQARQRRCHAAARHCCGSCRTRQGQYSPCRMHCGAVFPPAQRTQTHCCLSCRQAQFTAKIAKKTVFCRMYHPSCTMTVFSKSRCHRRAVLLPGQKDALVGRHGLLLAVWKGTRPVLLRVQQRRVCSMCCSAACCAAGVSAATQSLGTHRR